VRALDKPLREQAVRIAAVRVERQSGKCPELALLFSSKLLAIRS
jgi:hypothetical protein